MGKKHLILILIVFLFYFFYPLSCSANTLESQTFEQENYLKVVAPADISFREKKVEVIKVVLKKYNSPLITAVDTFVEACVSYELNCYLLPAISGVESSFGKFVKVGTYNPFGWGGGKIHFSSWSDGILQVAAGIRKNYLDKGAITIGEVGRIYCEGENWPDNVSYFIREFERVEQQIKQLQSGTYTVKL